ncbi:hypothetical protein RN001_009671 [Aquatica leii]|uniref:Serpin domain-containing protein n=1 Tax=Aquatica leii TaxID=1421715 RepID=A0AAN7NZW2_9COLE|nr:hypothetical protein RN001_009671 [Aquatica leii]
MKIINPMLLLIGVISSNSSSLYNNSILLFTSDLYKEYAKNNNGNFLLSPSSLHAVLSLATVGGKENTLQQLSKALHLPPDAQKIQSMFQTLTPNFEVTKLYQFGSANKMYVHESMTIKKEYEETAANVFKTDVENVDFNNKKETTSKINKWVESKTDSKIKDLIKENSLDSNVGLILVNALYFHGFWLNEFEPANLGFFYLNKTQVVNTEMMYQRKYFKYYEDDLLDAQFLEMPFKGDNVVMTFVLPKKVDGLASLEQNISKVLAVDNLSLADVEVGIPKFKIESDVDLKPLLNSIGIVEPFTSFANFKGISDHFPLYIGRTFQKTFLEITEKGATATAATDLTIVLHSFPDALFTADHPFLFYLKHKIYGIFFVGRSEPMIFDELPLKEKEVTNLIDFYDNVPSTSWEGNDDILPRR